MADENSAAVAKADMGVIDLTLTSAEEAVAQEPVGAGDESLEEDPMTTEEFLAKRADMSHT